MAVLLGFTLFYSPAIILVIVGAFLRERNPRAAKVLFIIAAVYVVVGTGYCGWVLQGA